MSQPNIAAETSILLGVLGLKPGCSREQVRATYAHMCHVWDPERFEDDDTLKEASVQKRAELEYAYQRVNEINPWAGEKRVYKAQVKLEDENASRPQVNPAVATALFPFQVALGAAEMTSRTFFRSGLQLAIGFALLLYLVPSSNKDAARAIETGIIKKLPAPLYEAVRVTEPTEKR